MESMKPALNEEIIQKEEEIKNAMLSGDIESLDQLIHDDLLFHIPTGQVASKKMDIEAYRSGLMKLNTLEYQDRQIKMHDDLAIVSVTVKMEGNFGDQAIAGQFQFLRVWKKTNGFWKITAGSSTAL